MVVSIHGGPANLNAQHWPGDRFDMSVLSALGYFVFFPNPRGSYGQGEAFTRANVKDFGYGDLRDILAGVDAVLKTVPVDRQPPRRHRLELRRLHDHVDRDPDQPLPAPPSPAPASPTGRATTAKIPSTSG